MGRFSGRKGQRGKIIDPNTLKPPPKKKPAKSKQTVAKRPRETASESEVNAKEQPKKKRVRYAYITSSSSSSESDDDDTTDADYAPSKKKEAVSSSSQHQSGKVEYKKALPPLLNRKCIICNAFEWKNDQDLRSHRDTVHPNTPLVDLMAVLCPVSKSRKDKSNKHVKKDVVEKVAGKKETKKADKNNKKVVPAKPEKKVPDTSKEVKAKKTSNVPKKGEKTSPDALAKKNRIVRKCRAKNSHVPRSQFPLPDSTFSKKEKFLHELGLSNSVRLHIHERKPIEELKLRPCSVKVQKLSDLEVAFYSNQGAFPSSLQNILQGHFLAS